MSDRIDSWEDYAVQERGLLPNSVNLYRRTLETLESEVGEISELDTETVRGWLLKKGGSASARGNRLSALRSFYRWQVLTDLRTDDPTIKIKAPKRHKSIPKPVTDLESALRRLDEEDEHANAYGAIPRRVGESRDMAVFLCYTGLRIHEAVKCDWPVPCPEEAFVIGKGNKEELMQIHPKAREAWDRLGRWPIGARATQRRFERAGFTPHMCRHWLATTLVRSGVEIGRVSKIMRHSSPTVTMGYAAYQKEQNREALDLLP